MKSILETLQDDVTENAETSRIKGRSTTGLLILGAWLLLGCIELSWISWKPPFVPKDSLREQAETYFFHWARFLPAGILVLYVPYFFSLYLVPKTRGALGVVLAFSFLLRVALVPGAPILETDIYRYLWDGRMVGMGQNPYLYSPLDVEQALGAAERSEQQGLSAIVEETREDPLFVEILDHINNKKVPTIYSPTAQAAFAVGSGLIRVLVPAGPNDPESDWSQRALWAIVVWKALLLLFDLAVLWTIVSLLKRLSMRPEWVVVYGWSPLVLKEYANTGHFDPLVLFFTLASLRALLDVPGKASVAYRWKRVLAGLSLALAIGVKIFPILFLPTLWRRLRIPGIVAVGIAVAAIHLPFLEVGDRLFTGLATYSEHWENNSSLVSPLEWSVSRVQDLFRETPEGGEGSAEPDAMFEFAGVSFYLDAFFAAKAMTGCLLLGGIGWIAFRPRGGDVVGLEADRKTVREVYWIVGLLLVASPTCFSWYVGWIVPFLCFFPNKAWLFLTFAVQAYYLRFWTEPVDYLRFEDLPFLGIDSKWEIARPLEYIPFYLLLLYGCRLDRRSSEAAPAPVENARTP